MLDDIKKTLWATADKLRANMDRLPEGVPEPIVKAKGINDVPMLTLTLSPDVTRQGRWDEATLRTMRRPLDTVRPCNAWIRIPQ